MFEAYSTSFAWHGCKICWRVAMEGGNGGRSLAGGDEVRCIKHGGLV